jgi:hypothetical protein
MSNIFASDPVPFDGPKYVSPQDYRESEENSQIRQMQLAGGRAKLGGDAASAALAQERKQRLIDANGDIGVFGQMSAKAGDYEAATEAEKQILGSTKSRTDITGKEIDNNEKLSEAESLMASMIYDNPSIQSVQYAAQAAAGRGMGRAAAHLNELLQTNPDATPEEIRAYFEPMAKQNLKTADRMPKYQDGTQINPNAAQGSMQTLPMSAYQKESANTARGHLGVAQERLAFEKTKERAASTSQQKLEEKDRLTAQSAENSLKLISGLEELVTANPRSTATPLAGVARAYEAARSVFDPNNKDAPAIEFAQKRDALIATAEGLKKDSRMSNQDRQRLENALGAGSMTTPENTLKSLGVIKEIIVKMSKAGSPGSSGTWTDL